MSPRFTQVWRAAIDAVKKDQAGFTPGGFKPEAAWMAQLNKVSEGSMHTLGAYYRPWK